MEDFDVVIYEVATGTVAEVIGPYPENGYYNVDKMRSTIASRLNDDYFTTIKPSGEITEGEVLPGYND